MSQFILFVPIFFPIIVGLLMLSLTRRKFSAAAVEVVVIINSLMILGIILSGIGRDEGALFFTLATGLDVFFKVDGMGMVFAGLIAFLWPLATIYAFEYMENDERKTSFFAFYTMTFGVTTGIAFSGNLVTLYIFYEMLTLVTFPLVLHYRDRFSRRAARTYLYYSLGGAAFAFIGLVFVMTYGITTDFVYGGVINELSGGFSRNIMLGMYVLAFFGFGVKSAVVPVQRWLPSASVAPTPVTALLHAVAVVKSGAFAILRLTYFSFGAEFLRGTWAQYLVLAFVLITVFYGSTMAVKEVHFKKRLAYSTISNLSYILLGAVMMTPMGLIAALSHLVFHAFMKICSFFCAGAVMHKAGLNYVYELDGIGRKMPVTFVCFTIAGISLTGIPLFAGFVSKWNIARAVLDMGGKLSVIALAVLLYSAFMTGIYMLSISVRAFCPDKGMDMAVLEGIHDPGWKMLVPIVIFAVIIILFGIYSQPLMSIISDIARGVL